MKTEDISLYSYNYGEVLNLVPSDKYNLVKRFIGNQDDYED